MKNKSDLWGDFAWECSRLNNLFGVLGIGQCDHDAFPICDQMMSSGLKIYKVDYCETCPVRVL
jgi:hypothetical protein